ncbi:hypothetical protein I4F81_002401 [Pyropia yezoensis]|uniref:Uncharacterized protein n=1 Tax=Pyropia yezoensis TaxID=2788 RepID=A0ACC3BPQ3_PYRYE|nr:hypothetical protein I4F81_002401 [Neopyropia yezoensis]
MIFKKEDSGLYRITRKKTVEEVVIHGEELDPSLKTSEAGGAHVVSLNAPDAASFFRDSPYAWGDKKGCSKTTILVSGRWRSYDVNTRACVPPMVCSRMPADVANKSHSEVEFETPSWLSATKLCMEDETPARQVERTTLAFWKLVQQSLESGCSFTDEEGTQCGGTPKVMPARKSRGAFIGCSDWKRGDPPTYLGGHMARWVPAGVDLDRLATWLDEGVEGLGEADTCTFTAPRRCRELVCKRHGGEFPSLVRSSGGRCPSRVEVYTPREKSGGGPVCVVVVMRGTHSHVVPVCKPRSSLVHSVVQENASESIRTLQNAISDASGGSLVRSSFVRQLRRKARLKEHPYGQDILGVSDLYRRAASQHDYVKAIIQKPDYTIIILQTEEQAVLSGKLRYIQANSTLGVVAAGSAKEGVEAAAIQSAGKRAFEWDLFNIVYVISLILWSFTLFRAMVIGKSTDGYEDLFAYYFRVAEANGLVGPPVRRAPVSGGSAQPRCASFVSATMDFETGQHQGFFRGVARVFKGQPSNYHGRVVGCGVHLKRFLLAPCGNNLKDPFFSRIVHLRETATDLDIAQLRCNLAEMTSACEEEGATRKTNIIQWLLQNNAALLAAFPCSAGVLDKFELLASSSDTNACESLNRQTKQVLVQRGASTLMEVVAALADFDRRTMASLATPGREVAAGAS